MQLDCERSRPANLRTIVTLFEYLCCSISFNQTEMVLLTIYRPGSKPATQKFIDELTTILEILSTYHRPIVITSDINIRVERENNAMATQFREMLASLDLIIHSTAATHRCGGQLDLVITRSDMSDLRRECSRNWYIGSLDAGFQSSTS